MVYTKNPSGYHIVFYYYIVTKLRYLYLEEIELLLNTHSSALTRSSVIEATRLLEPYTKS